MMKNFILNWRTSVKRDVLNENKIIHEASEEEIEVLEDILSDLDPAQLPLNKAFGGKLRKVIPLEAVGGEVGDMANALGEAGYVVDLKDGTVSYETSREHEGKVYKGKKTLKINKVLNGLLKLKDGERVNRERYSKARADHYSGAEADDSVYQKAVVDYEQEVKKIRDIGKKAFRGMDRWVHLIHVQKYIKAWEANAGFFKNNPEALSGFSIIMSRHPTDVLRMSDFDNIESCHTLSSRSGEEGSFIKCAYAEAREGGAIAYVVPAEEIKDFEEESGVSIEDFDGEILSDSARSVGDIEPVSRIRVRIGRFDDYDYRYYIGVPDRRVYGDQVSNFYETVKAWLVDNQEDTIKKLPKITEDDVGDRQGGYRNTSESDVGKIAANKITRIGGTYQDNPFESLLTSLLSPPGSDQQIGGLVMGKPHVESTEDDIDLPDDGRRTAMEEELNEAAEQANNRYDHCNIYVEMDDYGEGLDISAHADCRIELDVGKASGVNPDGLTGRITADGISNLNENGTGIGEAVLENFYEMGGMQWAGGVGESITNFSLFYNKYSGGQVILNIGFKPSDDIGGEGYIYDIDTFEQFADAIEEIDGLVDSTLKKILETTLMQEDILETSGFHKFMVQAMNDEFAEINDEIDETDWSFDVMPDELRVDIDMTVEFKIDDIKGLEDIYYTEDAIKEIGMSREFGVALRQLIFNEVPGFIPGESMYPDLTRRYVTGRPGGATPTLGVSFTIDDEDPPGALESAMGLIKYIKEETVEELAKQAYSGIVRQGTSYATKAYKEKDKQQDLPFGSEESEKSLNERLHRNWSGFLNS